MTGWAIDRSSGAVTTDGDVRNCLSTEHSVLCGLLDEINQLLMQETLRRRAGNPPRIPDKIVTDYVGTVSVVVATTDRTNRYGATILLQHRYAVDGSD